MAGQRSRAERLAAALIARHDFAAAVRILNRVGIIPMPLKGVLLQHLVYRDPADRLLSDADVLIPPGRFDEAIAALRAEGHSVAPEGRAGATTKGPRAHLDVDVHRRLFSPGLYALDAERMFAHGKLEPTLFGATVVIPAPLDLYAHLVGNFAKGRHGARDIPQIRDFAAVASHYGLDAETVARHLEVHGLARAARYALPHASADGDDFAASVLAHLRSDPVGALSASAARALTARFGGEASVSLLAAHLVNTSLPRGATSALVHVALGLRTRFAHR